MPLVALYTSTQGWPRTINLALDMQAKHGYQLRSLRQLPPPRPVRVAALRLELAGLLQDERTIRWTLSQYAAGLRLPDACREADLQADLTVTLWRTGIVTTTLNQLGELSHE